MRTTLFSAAIVVCAALSLTPKVLSAISSAEDKPIVSSVPNAVSEHLSSRGFVWFGSRPLANDGIHMAQFYRSPSCPGWLATVRLSRNAEGVHLLSALNRDPGMETVFYLKDQRYDDYPEIAAVIHRIWNGALDRIGMDEAPSDVWAITGRSSCLPEN